MKKLGKQILFVTAMLCLFLFSGLCGVKGHAATGNVSVPGADLPRSVIVKGISYDIDANGDATVTDIGNIKKAVINEVEVDDITYPVTGIAANASRNNRILESVSIGSNVKKIGKNAFKNCENLKKVRIRANKKLKVGKGAFKKLGRDAVVTVKGVQGKRKDKIVKVLKKRTDAAVK